MKLRKKCLAATPNVFYSYYLDHLPDFCTLKIFSIFKSFNYGIEIMKCAVACINTLVLALLLTACASSDQEGNKKQDQGQDPQIPLFSLISSKHSGILFRNKLPENRYMNILTYQYYYNGGGVAIGDINNDGLPDLFFTGNISPNRLYLNLGNFQFEDITENAGIRNPSQSSWCTGANMVDINDDGWLDIYVCRSGNLQPENRKNLLFINNGDNTFIESAALYNLNDEGYSIQSTFFDFDHDNDLDMFLTNHGINYYGRDESRSQQNDLNYFAGDRLYRNDEGYFKDVSQEAGIYSRSYSFGLGLGIGDLNNDGWDDIYVSNDFYEHDYMYLNNGNGTFTESVKNATSQISYFGMGNDIGDINNDGLLDILVVDMPARDHERRLTNLAGISYDKYNEFIDKGFHYQYMYNSLNLNNGNGTFSNIAQLLNIANTDWSWAPLIVDLDNNGHKDVFISNGLRKDALNLDFINSVNTSLANKLNPEGELTDQQFMEILTKMPSQRLTNYVFANQGNFQMEEKMTEWGLNHKTFSNGAAYGDLDNDGDLDLVVNNLDDLPYLYKNNADLTDNHFIRVRLKGPAGNSLGLGSKIKVKAGGKDLFYQHYLSRGYQSSMDPVIVIGLGEADIAEKIMVEWPDGKVTTLSDQSANQEIELDYQLANSNNTSQETNEVLFEDITAQMGIEYRHRENNFDDFRYEMLLPYRQSTLGPALAVRDVNGDNLDDFYIGGAQGYSGNLYIQTSAGKFRLAGTKPWSEDKGSEDIDALFVDVDGDSDQDLYVVSGGSEYPANDAHYQDRLYLNNGDGDFTKAAPGYLPEFFTSGGAVCAADYDLDGDLDLFVGGRLVPGKYGMPAQSYLLTNEGDRFEINRNVLQEPFGMVTDALWQDLNDDQIPELVIAGEWMPVTILQSADGRLKDITGEYGLADTNGWYFSLTAADFNQDGRTDLIAGNLGLNYRYKASKESPFELVGGDFDQNNDYDAILAYHQKGNLYPFELRDKLFDQMRFIKSKFPEHQKYSKATVEELIGKVQLDQALRLKATQFASIYLENQGSRFSVKELPAPAQISVGMDLESDDFNQDGIPDLIMAGNLFHSEHQTARLDAGTGVYLENKQGEFQAIRGTGKGFWVSGDVRKMKILRTAAGKMVVVAKNQQPLQFLKVIQP